MTYLLAILNPKRVEKFAALSGFIPQGAEGMLPPGSFTGKKVFVSHNRQDEMVPVEKARQAVEFLQKAGAQVSFCENEGGHKVSKECMAGLEGFFASG